MSDTLLSDSYDVNTVYSIGELSFHVPASALPLSKKEIREIYMREIYDFYLAEFDKRRKENWKRYIVYLKTNRIDEKIKGRTKTYNTFKRTKPFIREISYDSLKWLLKHVPTDDLTYFTSTGKEFGHTGRSFGSWLAKWFPKIQL